jgi:hypothetical protein
MSVPLFDTRTPLAPLRGEIDAKLAELVDLPLPAGGCEQAGEMVAAVRDAGLGRPH